VNFGVADLQARKHVSKPGAAHARAHYDKYPARTCLRLGTAAATSRCGSRRRYVSELRVGDDYAEARASAACVTGSVGRSKHPV